MSEKCKTRIEWLDAVKGIAILTVVLGHVLLGFTENDIFINVNDTLEKINSWIYTWHMPLFFFLSGYAFRLSCLNENSLRKLEKIKRNVFNFIILYLSFQCALCVLKVVFSKFVDNKMAVEKIIYSLLFPNTLMWYLWVLIIYYIVFSFFNQNIYKKEWMIGCICMSIIGEYLAENMNFSLCFRNLFANLFFFAFGIFFSEKIKEIKTKAMYINYIYISIYFALCMFSSFEISNLKKIGNIILANVNAFTLILSIVYLFQVKLKNVSKMLSSLGRASLVIYLLHTYIVTAIKVLIIKINVENCILAIFFTWGLSVLITYGVYCVTCRCRLLSYVFKPISLIDLRRKK